ncbi:uncharacterized protein LOC109849916 [Asparagus officinalis]|nr:uncharacterized protein LOC109849916 [Asparagus officinalis]
MLMNDRKIDILHKFGAFVAFPDPSMEGASKWNPGCYTHLKLLDDQQSELELAHRRITELETERHLAKKKLDLLVRKLAEEKESWQRKEHEKIRGVIDSIKDDIHRERKNRQRMEITKSKLVNELAEAKSLGKRFLQDYEKEKKTRELMEEVCDELAKEIGEDKAKVEEIKADSSRVRDELEEERKMLQMAEVWREERVQMKLVNAKVTLEEKYLQLSKLQAKIEAFLKARSSEEENKEVEVLREAANCAKAQEVKEFSYRPSPRSEEIFSVFEELKTRDKPNEKEIEACDAKGTAAADDDDCGLGTVSHGEEQGSSNSIEGSEPSVNEICEESSASVSGRDWDENEDNGKVSSEISEVCSVGTKQSRFWRPSYQSNGENGHRNSTENGRLSYERISNVILVSDGMSGEMGLISQTVGCCSSPESVNQCINRGIEQCIEWPRGIEKHSLKAKLLEARIESQKIQLRPALQQKI